MHTPPRRFSTFYAKQRGCSPLYMCRVFCLMFHNEVLTCIWVILLYKWIVHRYPLFYKKIFLCVGVCSRFVDEVCRMSAAQLHLPPHLYDSTGNSVSKCISVTDSICTKYPSHNVSWFIFCVIIIIIIYHCDNTSIFLLVCLSLLTPLIAHKLQLTSIERSS